MIRMLGLDLSLRKTGMVIVPGDWSNVFSRVQSWTAGRSLSSDADERAHIERIRDIVQAVVKFAVEYGATHAAIENYAFNQHSSSAHRLAELGGAVKLALGALDLWPMVFPVQSARKLLLGRVPRVNGKAFVGEMLRKAGAPFETDDEADALAIANYALSELGFGCITLAENKNEKPEALKTPRVSCSPTVDDGRRKNRARPSESQGAK